MNNQRGFIPAFLLPYVGYALAGLAVVAILSLAVHKYNEWIREPYKQQIALWEKTIERNKKEAADLLKQREKENADLAEKWRVYARESDENYTKQLAAITARTNAGNGMRFTDPFGRNGCSPAGQAGKDSTATPEGAATGGELSKELSDFLRAEADRADKIAAWAKSCHGHIND